MRDAFPVSENTFLLLTHTVKQNKAVNQINSLHAESFYLLISLSKLKFYRSVSGI